MGFLFYKYRDLGQHLPPKFLLNLKFSKRADEKIASVPFVQFRYGTDTAVLLVQNRSNLDEKKKFFWRTSPFKKYTTLLVSFYILNLSSFLCYLENCLPLIFLEIEEEKTFLFLYFTK